MGPDRTVTGPARRRASGSPPPHAARGGQPARRSRQGERDGGGGRDSGARLPHGGVQRLGGGLHAQPLAAGVPFSAGLLHAQQDGRLIGVARLPRIARAASLLGVVALAQCPQAGIAFCAGVGQRGIGRGGLLFMVPAIGAVVAGVAGQRAAFQRHDVRHRVQQGPIMAGDDQAAAPGGQPVHQPAPGAGVQVIGGLVQQQSVGALRQRAGQRHAGQLAAADGACRPFRRPGRQAGVRQHARPFLADAPAAIHQVEVGLAAGAGLDARQGAQRRRHARHIRQRDARAGGQGLRHGGDASATLDAAGLRRQFAEQQSQQQRLACAVAADQAVARGGEIVAGVFQQHAAVGQRMADVAQADMESRRERRAGQRKRAAPARVGVRGP